MKDSTRLYFKGRFAYSFGKNGQGLLNEFDLINQLVNVLGKDNFVTIHKSFIDQTDNVYDLVFDVVPRDNVEYLFVDVNNETTIGS